jgi:hypothetical protein
LFDQEWKSPLKKGGKKKAVCGCHNNNEATH